MTPEPTSHTVRVNGIRLSYMLWDSARYPRASAPPTLLFIHGDMRTSRSWDAVARHLQNDFRMIALDMRGHGASDWPNEGYTFAQRIDDLEAFADSVGIRGAVGVAHSTGGVVCAMLAARRPDIFDKLALLEPMLEVDEAFQRMVSQRAERPRRTWANRDEMRDYLKAHQMAGRWRADVIEDVVARESYELPNGRLDMRWAAASMNWKEREGDYLDLKPTLAALDKPILFIVSDARADSFQEIERIERERPSFSALTIADSGHNMYMNDPAAIAHAVRHFTYGDSDTP